MSILRLFLRASNAFRASMGFGGHCPGGGPGGQTLVEGGGGGVEGASPSASRPSPAPEPSPRVMMRSESRRSVKCFHARKTTRNIDIYVTRHKITGKLVKASSNLKIYLY